MGITATTLDLFVKVHLEAASLILSYHPGLENYYLTGLFP